jgi:hypothetical protein
VRCCANLRFGFLGVQRARNSIRGEVALALPRLIPAAAPYVKKI